MSYVHTFEGFRPPPREDGDPWTGVVPHQAADALGTGEATLSTITLSPLDADPTDPALRDFSVEDATAPEAWFRFYFRDAIGGLSAPSEWILSPGIGLAYTPTRGDVGTLLRARTLGENTEGEMVELGTFGDTTRPTGAAVDGLIRQAVGKVAAIGAVPVALYEQARHAAVLYAAMLVELSYYPEQTTEDDSAYRRLKELFDEAMASLIGAMPDTDATRKGIYSVPMTAVGSTYPFDASEDLLP